MSMSDSSLAVGRGAGVKNVVLKPGSEILNRKILIIGTPDPTKASGLNLNLPTLVLSPDQVGAESGFGFMPYRLAKAVFRGTNYSVPVYIMYEAEASGAAAAAGAIAVTVTTALKGTLYMYIAGKLYTIAVAAGATATAIGELIEAAINADAECPVTAENTTGTVAITAKSKGVWGNYVSIAFNQDKAAGQALPGGVSIAITAMTTGAGTPDLAADLATALGVGSAANEAHFTDIVHGYVQDTTALNALSQYVGEGNEYTGLYDRNVARPFRSLTGDTATGSSALTALIAIGDARKNDRCNGIVARPGSLTHPSEIAAELMGKIAALAKERAEAPYYDLILSGVDKGLVARSSGLDWTVQYDSRDIAVKAGISPLVIEGGAVKTINVISFYRPASIPQTSNAYREMRNIAIIQNILYNKLLAYKSETWVGCTLVADKAAVTVAASRAKVRDRDDVIDTELALLLAFMSRGWVYDTAYTIAALKLSTAVQIRTGGDGFTTQVPYILSGIANIIDTESYVDTSIAVTQGTAA